MRRVSDPRLIAVVMLLLAAPIVGQAQPARKIYRISSLLSEEPATPAGQGPFWERLRQLGWVYGRDVVFEHRVFGTDTARIPALAKELIGSGADVFVVSNGTVASGVRKATQTIPIVTTSAGDLVAARLVESVARPGGNVTGVQVMQTELGGKHLSLLKEMIPKLARVGLLVGEHGFTEAQLDSTHATAIYVREVKAAAGALGLHLQVVVPAKGDEFESAFASLKAQAAQAVVVYSSSLTFSQRKSIVALGATNRLPTVCLHDLWLSEGCLMSYGWDRLASLRLAAEFVDRILRGSKAADLPVQQPSAFLLGINLRTARTLGLAVPPSIRARADYTIE